MNKYFCAVDGGNSTINIVINGETYNKMFPSIQADYMGAKLSYANEAIWGKDDTTQLWKKLHVETALDVNTPGKTDRTEFLFGHMAEEYQKDLRSRQNKEKFQDKALAKWMITSLAFALLETKQREDGYKIKKNDKLQFNVVLSAGLPYREGKYPEKRKAWADLFKGTHRVNFKHPLFKNLSIDLVVEEVIPVIEGEMALTLELNKKDGIAEVTPPEELLDKKYAIIDIGGHTTEIVTVNYVMSETNQDENKVYDEYLDDTEIKVKQVTKIDLTDGIERGVATVMEDVIADVSEEYRNKQIPLKTLVRRDIERAFTNRGKFNGKRGWILPEQIYIKDLFDKQSQNLASDIVNKVHLMFGEIISEIDTIYLCGGGSRIDSIVSSVKRELGRLGYNSEKIIALDDPVMANVRGYYLMMTYYRSDCPSLENN